MNSRGENEDSEIWGLIHQNEEALLRIAGAAVQLVHSLVEVSHSISLQSLPVSVSSPFRQAVESAHLLTSSIEDYDMQYNESQTQIEDLTDELRRDLQQLTHEKYE